MVAPGFRACDLASPEYGYDLKLLGILMLTVCAFGAVMTTLLDCRHARLPALDYACHKVIVTIHFKRTCRAYYAPTRSQHDILYTVDPVINTDRLCL